MTQAPKRIRQRRAVQTRQAVLVAAASVFDERGYQAASVCEILARAEVTKGALYFHFPSKEALAQAVIESQAASIAVPERELRLQALVDLMLLVAERLKTDVILRAGIRLTIEQGSFQDLDPAPYRQWIEFARSILAEAARRGELLPHVDPDRVAEMIIGCFSGIQLLAQVLTDRADLAARIAGFWAHLLPGIAVPGVLPAIRTSIPDDLALD